MKIGNLTLENNVLLAPMAGITNLPFRILLRRFGCALAFTEMISASGLIRESSKTLRYLQSSLVDRPLGVQLFGSNAVTLSEAAKIAADHGADCIDLNMGCPARKVLRTGAGASLLKNPLQISCIISALRKAVSLPLTVKIRSGFSHREMNAVKIAVIAEECGVDAVIVHPRTAVQGFKGTADWTVIEAVKDAVRIPVIGNGDIQNAADAEEMTRTTGCDGVMIGRGVLGNPWLMMEAVACLNRKDLPNHPSVPAREALIKLHLEMEVRFSGDRQGSRNFRKHLLWYTKGLPEGAKFRKRVAVLSDKDSILQELRYLFESLHESGERRNMVLTFPEGLGIIPFKIS